ncbi:hypothetical protein OV079_20365 [Nannocystis pusilla]|uniref:Uncharacterized protein n=1 Tax=Nannocystis pusilla TaxID=889268 RepID=A0A9X3EXM3_9BACT|nr:hypothetical protein [Nannocystis pusilla]MCY1007866.1 hypothetical protein [Nannocystis pusilla]
MSILHRLRSDLQRSVAEHQAILLAQVLRQRFTELTLGDLREILTSPLGRGLDNLKLAELSQNAGAGDAGKPSGKGEARGRTGVQGRRVCAGAVRTLAERHQQRLRVFHRRDAAGRRDRADIR